MSGRLMPCLLMTATTGLARPILSVIPDHDGLRTAIHSRRRPKWHWPLHLPAPYAQRQRCCWPLRVPHPPPRPLTPPLAEPLRPRLRCAFALGSPYACCAQQPLQPLLRQPPPLLEGNGLTCGCMSKVVMKASRRLSPSV